jgi:hypothetical protein
MILLREKTLSVFVGSVSLKNYGVFSDTFLASASGGSYRKWFKPFSRGRSLC